MLDYSGGTLPQGNYTINGGTLTIGSVTQSIGTFQLSGGAVNGAGTLTSNATHLIQAGTVNAVLAGSLGLTKSTSGSAAVNDPIYSGTTTVQDGYLTFTGRLPGGSYIISGGMLDIGLLSKSLSSFRITGGTVTGAGGVLSNRALTTCKRARSMLFSAARMASRKQPPVPPS